MPRFWMDFTTADLEAGALADSVAVLPFAAVEQHGPHLPLGTDSIIMEGYLSRVDALLAPSDPVVILPVQTIGCSLEHSAFPGTLSLSAPVALQAWIEIAEGVAKTGCRKLVLVTSHGGNSALLSVLALELRAKLDLFAVCAAWQRFGYPEGCFSQEEIAHGIHGGAIETSLMLAFRPDLVRRDRMIDAVPATLAMDRRNRWLKAGRPTGFGWMAQDLAESGAAGNALHASAEKGQICAQHGAEAFVALLGEIRDFDLAGLKSR